MGKRKPVRSRTARGTSQCGQCGGMIRPGQRMASVEHGPWICVEHLLPQAEADYVQALGAAMATQLGPARPLSVVSRPLAQQPPPPPRRAPCGCQSWTEGRSVKIRPCQAGCPAVGMLTLSAAVLRRDVQVLPALRAV